METDRGDPHDRGWLMVSVLSPPRGEEPLLVDALRRVGARLIEREGERVVAHVPARGEVAAVLRELEAAIRTSTSLGDVGLSWRWRSEAEWEARWAREVGTRRVGERIIVAPPGADVAPAAGAGDLVIRLTSGLAFGTAEHATTRACLGFMERLVAAGDRLADVGAGSGILSIGAALLGARRVLALEADGLACEDARRNVALNGVSDRVAVREVEVGPREVRKLRRCDGVMANLEVGTLVPLLAPLGRVLGAGSWLLVSGILRTERPAFVAAARSAGLHLESARIDGGWWTACFRRAAAVAPPAASALP